MQAMGHTRKRLFRARKIHGCMGFAPALVRHQLHKETRMAAPLSVKMEVILFSREDTRARGIANPSQQVGKHRLNIRLFQRNPTRNGLNFFKPRSAIRCDKSSDATKSFNTRSKSACTASLAPAAVKLGTRNSNNFS